MTTVWVCATPHGRDYYDTEHEANTAARELNSTNRAKEYQLHPGSYVNRQPADIAHVYPITVEPDTRGDDYWNRNREAAA